MHSAYGDAALGDRRCRRQVRLKPASAVTPRSGVREGTSDHHEGDGNYAKDTRSSRHTKLTIPVLAHFRVFHPSTRIRRHMLTGAIIEELDAAVQ
jgi:hypothetical protein